jgi:hypothetical protein
MDEVLMLLSLYIHGRKPLHFLILPGAVVYRHPPGFYFISCFICLTNWTITPATANRIYRMSPKYLDKYQSNLEKTFSNSALVFATVSVFRPSPLIILSTHPHHHHPAVISTGLAVAYNNERRRQDVHLPCLIF